MSFLSILQTVFIGPLKLAFEVIFSVANSLVGHPGFAIVFLSLTMNILVLPLYKRADAMQEQARDTELRLAKGVAHIKKTFSGDERMMILQTYYRQNNYKPTDALHGSVSLLLEIPFFMAAYQFLSGLYILDGVSFGPITDLGKPDGLLNIAGLQVNLLPILMTAVNVVSSAIYLKGFPLKTKIQLYAMAGFFLVFLYTSPSCLVFYWTLNNVFSLVKTLCYKLKGPWQRIKSELPAPKPLSAQPNRKVFLLACLLLTVLVGVLIPSAVISASTQEFVDIFFYHNPLNYLLASAALAAGTFLVWLRVFYWLASDRGKVIFERILLIACGTALVNYLFFGMKLGMISPTLKYDKGLVYSVAETLINTAVFLGVGTGMYMLATKGKRFVASVLLLAVVATGGMSAINMVTIDRSAKQALSYSTDTTGDAPHFRISQTGKNVIVIMLDRAMGQYLPYIVEENPKLKAQLDGFTYYSNTVSFGGHTNFGTPALFGGYEYTPVEMNKRKDESLLSKHNEALKVMPVLFSQANYEVTVCDPPYAGYTWVPDLSIYEDYPQISAYITKGKYSSENQKQAVIANNYRNFFCFGLMKTMPVGLQQFLYDNGRYYQVCASERELEFFDQVNFGLSRAEGISNVFLDAYSVLENLPQMTQITQDPVNTFLSFTNDAAHEPMLLQMPHYTPATSVDNTPFDKQVLQAEGNSLRFDNILQKGLYHVNMGTLVQLGNWFDFLREKGVYDNTRIILVSDHGYNAGQIDALQVENGAGETVDMEFYYPLLMVKDFGATGFTTSTEFMTNGDVPTLATQGVLENPVNPFTGKPINSSEKTAHDQLVILSRGWDVDENNGNAYLPGPWASITGSIWEKDNWKFLNRDAVLTEHKIP